MQRMLSESNKSPKKSPVARRMPGSIHNIDQIYTKLMEADANTFENEKKH